MNESQVHFDYKFPHLCTIYKMSGRSLSVYKDTSASHEYLCALIKNKHEFCKLLIRNDEMIRKARSLTLYGSKVSELGSKGSKFSELSIIRLERLGDEA